MTLEFTPQLMSTSSEGYQDVHTMKRLQNLLYLWFKYLWWRSSTRQTLILACLTGSSPNYFHSQIMVLPTCVLTGSTGRELGCRYFGYFWKTGTRAAAPDQFVFFPFYTNDPIHRSWGCSPQLVPVFVDVWWLVINLNAFAKILRGEPL